MGCLDVCRQGFQVCPDMEKPPKSSTTSREAKLAIALRANLLRRKAAGRAAVKPGPGDKARPQAED